MTNDQLIVAAIYAFGLANGLVIGWFTWRLPMIFAEQRGQELDADGLTICSKAVAAAGRAAIEAEAEPLNNDAKDAARYRFIRANGDPAPGLAYQDYWSEANYDAAIDAAILQSEIAAIEAEVRK